MSSVTLAVAPRTDPNETATTSAPKPKQNSLRQQQPAVGGVMGSLRVIELQLVAFIMVFSASGLVPLLDLVFPAVTSAYLLVLSRLVFPLYGTTTGSTEILQGSRLFRFYVVLGTTIGLFLPLAYVLGGFARGDEHAVRSATPHLFLLSFQILTENIISGLSLFSPPVRALVPLLYTVRRIFVIVDWIYDVWVNKALPANAQFQDVAWFWFGRGLAVASLVYFSINLFGFLIPIFLPRAFERYFKERDEVQAKTAEDKRSAAANKLPTDKKAD
ncbi:Large proline-rich protein [Actinidia chinensis var. chinensis]|uniref:Large proline-rich protein n=1 Tax=Actinidia chinensis var. chinensis TaxID=1590841 RepID=A0A2R6RF19_ACTCC|nr:Large proline-rich protein [Actinidia chinensis var. chinensis]